MNYPDCMSPDGPTCDAFNDIVKENCGLKDRLQKCEALGKWVSAALDDPQVCDDMKADIRTYFEGLGDLAKYAEPAIDYTPSHHVRCFIKQCQGECFERFRD